MLALRSRSAMPSRPVIRRLGCPPRGCGRHRDLLRSASYCCAGPGRRPEVLHSLLYTCSLPLDLFQVQPSSDNLIVADLEQGHPAHLKGPTIAAGTRPAPFGPGRVTVLDRLADLGVEVGTPANMASQLARIWARPVKALPGCAGCSLRKSSRKKPAAASRSCAFMATANRSITPLITSSSRLVRPLRASPWCPPLRGESSA